MFFRILTLIVIAVCLFGIGCPSVSASAADDLLLTGIVKNDMEIIKKAIAGGADINNAKKDQYTPLGVAVKSRNADVVEYLLKNKANPNIQMNPWLNYYTMPLIIAVENDDYKTVQLLLDAGANVNTAIAYKPDDGSGSNTDKGNTPLILAIQKEGADSPSLQIAKLLISYKADVNQANANGYTPLMAAADYKWGNTYKTRVSIANALLKAGADPSRKNTNGKTALQFATDTDFKEMIKLLSSVSPK